MRELLLAAAQETSHGSAFVPGLVLLVIGFVMTFVGVLRDAYSNHKKGGRLTVVGLIVLLWGVGIALFVK